jgi:hypothetical protein
MPDVVDRGSLSPNMREFDEICAVFLSEIYIAHPMPLTPDAEAIAKKLELSSAEATLPSGRRFEEILEHTAAWLVREGFIRDLSPVIGKSEFVLTDKGLRATNVRMPSLGGAMTTVGNNMVQATRADVVATSQGRTYLGTLTKFFLGG